MNDPAGRQAAHAMALTQAGNHQLAIPLLREALATSPHEVPLQLHLSFSLLATPEAATQGEGLALAERAAAHAPHQEWPHRLRALWLLRAGRDKEAIDAANEAVRQAPNLPSPLLTVAQCQQHAGRFAEAREAARAALRLDPQSVNALVAISGAEIGLQHLIAAEQFARKALAIDPNNAAALNNLGVARRAGGDIAGARESFLGSASSLAEGGTARSNLLKAVIDGSPRVLFVRRMIIFPGLAGAGFGYGGLVGLAVGVTVSVVVQFLGSEVRILRSPAASRPALHRGRNRAFLPRPLLQRINPLALIRFFRQVARSNGVGMVLRLIAGWIYLTGLSFGISAALGYSFS